MFLSLFNSGGCAGAKLNKGFIEAIGVGERNTGVKRASQEGLMIAIHSGELTGKGSGLDGGGCLLRFIYVTSEFFPTLARLDLIHVKFNTELLLYKTGLFNRHTKNFGLVKSKL